MITIYDQNNVAYFIRPCPLINITWNSSFNEDSTIGGKYDITLTGTLLDNGGSPIFNYDQRSDQTKDTSFISQYYPIGDGSKPVTQQNPVLSGLHSLLAKQIALRELFAKNCVKMEVSSVNPGDAEPLFTLYPKFISINFSEGIWVNKCDYTITLEAQFILDNNDKVIGSESYSNRIYKSGDSGWRIGENLTIDQIFDKIGGFIEDFQETWSLEPEEGNGNTVSPDSGAENRTRVYRLSRNISAKGKNVNGYECIGTQPKDYYRAHSQARRYIQKYIAASGSAMNDYDDYPSSSPLDLYFASGILNISALSHGGYNHSRTENIDVTQGTYSITDNWILSSGNSYENYSLSLNSSQTEPLTRVSIEGTIKGLTSIPSSGNIFGGNYSSTLNTAYENAINKYRAITNSGQFGINAHTYKRAQNAAGGIHLNDIPLTVALGTNEFTGEINYTIEYDSRPSNLISGVISENISVTDTYPGDVFAVIPVIGRPTGPILQYIGGRTEYQRQLSIELIVAPPGSGSNHRNNFLLKPSLVFPTSSGIVEAINAYSPGKDPGIRKYFVSPPQETWDPKEGRYSLNITWTYELNY